MLQKIRVAVGATVAAAAGRACARRRRRLEATPVDLARLEAVVEFQSVEGAKTDYDSMPFTTHKTYVAVVTEIVVHINTYI